MNLRRLNKQGIEQFANFLDSLSGETPLPFPSALLTDPEATEEVRPTIEIEQRNFGSRYAAAEYLYNLFKDSGLFEIERDRGLWAWLSLFYFEELCPTDAKGRRKPGRRERWFLVPTSRRFYLHQLAGPYQVYRAHANDPAVTVGLLCGPLNIIPRVYEEVAESPTLIASQAIVETATRLYYNPKTGTIRRNRSGQGGPRRLVGVLAQFDVTWDITSLSADDVWTLLPDEFSDLKRMYEADQFESLRSDSSLARSASPDRLSSGAHSRIHRPISN